jgi:hypothetical protein
VASENIDQFAALGGRERSFSNMPVEHADYFDKSPGRGNDARCPANQFPYGCRVPLVHIVFCDIRGIQIHCSAVFLEEAPAIASYGRKAPPKIAHVRQIGPGALFRNWTQFRNRFTTALNRNNRTVRGFADQFRSADMEIANRSFFHVLHGSTFLVVCVPGRL